MFGSRCAAPPRRFRGREATINEPTPRKGCPRCQGKLFTDKATGDGVCFTCGHVSYRDPPLEPLPGEPLRRRRATHAGVSLS
jgi:hypothetical protein